MAVSMIFVTFPIIAHPVFSVNHVGLRVKIIQKTSIWNVQQTNYIKFAATILETHCRPTQQSHSQTVAIFREICLPHLEPSEYHLRFDAAKAESDRKRLA